MLRARGSGMGVRRALRTGRCLLAGRSFALALRSWGSLGVRGLRLRLGVGFGVGLGVSLGFGFLVPVDIALLLAVGLEVGLVPAAALEAEHRRRDQPLERRLLAARAFAQGFVGTLLKRFDIELAGGAFVFVEGHCKASGHEGAVRNLNGETGAGPWEMSNRRWARAISARAQGSLPATHCPQAQGA